MYRKYKQYCLFVVLPSELTFLQIITNPAFENALRMEHDWNFLGVGISLSWLTTTFDSFDSIQHHARTLNIQQLKPHNSFPIF